jgi:hypothetical protein
VNAKNVTPAFPLATGLLIQFIIIYDNLHLIAGQENKQKNFIFGKKNARLYIHYILSKLPRPNAH